jgi:hypothetical protein
LAWQAAQTITIFRLTIDGQQLVSDLLTGSNATVVAANSGLGVAFPFVRDLLVEIRDAPQSSALTKFWVSYVTSHSEAIGEPEMRVDEFEGQPFLVRRTDYGDAESRYTIESLEGPLRWSRVDLDTDYYLAEEPITGTLTAWEGPQQYRMLIGDVDLLIRPHGFMRELDRFRVERVEPGARFEHRPRDESVHGGLFQVVADLPGVANIPGMFYRQ